MMELHQAEAQRIETLRRAYEIDAKWEQKKLEKEREEVAQLPASHTAIEEDRPPTTAPAGQGVTFEPGEWSAKPKARARS
ncbi:hypothetical protein HK097_005003 [Rhizophlyctis rosea]|uniref:Uncharacterized protein n=1 Tax=Rhizophlyctis rosea TaxID=64517 RepID=A0AAD5X2L9_9FUNG|nr:hypothetical protein HK097_005003 [Rhizophlyctis rosea]